jgi:mediator of RNA polymerase II transcription subunit 18
MVEESYRFFREDVEFCLSRQLFMRPLTDYARVDPNSAAPSSPVERLPAWESLTAVDLQDRWALQVKAHVVQDTKPDEIKKAQDQLMSIRGELDGVFDFRPVDRKVYDTRIALQAQGIQALPQKMTLGKT